MYYLSLQNFRTLLWSSGHQSRLTLAFFIMSFPSLSCQWTVIYQKSFANIELQKWRNWGLDLLLPVGSFLPRQIYWPLQYELPFHDKKYDTHKKRKFLELMDMFSTLIVVLVSFQDYSTASKVLHLHHLILELPLPTILVKRRLSHKNEIICLINWVNVRFRI